MTGQNYGLLALWALSIHQCCLNMCALFNAAPLKLASLFSATVSTLDGPSSLSRQRAFTTSQLIKRVPKQSLFLRFAKKFESLPPTYVFYGSINRCLEKFSEVSGNMNRYEDRRQTLFFYLT